MRKIEYKDIFETLYHDVCDNGLNVFLLKKEGFSKTYATYTAPIGGRNEIVIDGEKEIILPKGIAHFLEHKLFEKNGQDVSIEFAKNQANVNAFTSSNKTTYLFTATDNIEENVLLLLDFVRTPNFTKEGITKEVDIISQEIKMHIDNPGTKIYNTLLAQLYNDHPASNEILGSIESIKQLNEEILKVAHNTFYHPENMIFFVAGNIDPESLMKTIKQSQKENVEKKYQPKDVENEYSKVLIKDSTIYADIVTPQVLLGYKLPPLQKKDTIKLDLMLGMLLDVLFGKSSDYYQELMNQTLINDSFGKEAALDPHYSYIVVGGDTNHPKELLESLRNRLLQADKIEITDETFLKMKRRFVGSFVTAFNYLEFIANNFSKYYYLDHSLFDMLHLYKDITKEDLYKLAEELTHSDYITEVTLLPSKQE